MKDLMNHIASVVAIAPSVVADNTPQVGAIVDRQGFESLTYVIGTGVLADADATFTVLLEEGDSPTLADAVPVADKDLLGTELAAGFTFADDNKTRKLGYVGSKRYTRLTVTPVANSGAAPITALAVLGHPSLVPTSF